jgi:hypothetical protein
MPRTIEREAVAAIEETWRIDEGWWRGEEVSRRYWRIALANESVVVIYRDLGSGRWFEQSY